MTSSPEGILRLDKPAGPTSHDVVAWVRKALGLRRVGHTGTLDPFATGLMLVCVGRATRLAEYLTGMDKEYEAVARLGVATDTLDPEGEIVGEDEGWRALDERAITAALTSLRGEILQVPPQYSAKKVHGEAMHRRARRGETVALAPRSVTIHELELIALELPRVHLRVRCSSGTYIRALARDLGTRLGVGAHLTELRRTAVGSFGVDGALPADRLPQQGVPDDAWLPPLEALAHLPVREVDAGDARSLAQGRRLPVESGEVPVLCVVCDGALVAIAEITAGELKPRKVLATELSGG